MNKEVLVFLADDFADWELAHIAPALQKDGTGYIIKTFVLDKKNIVSQGGLKITTDYTLATIPDDYAILLMIGGMIYAEANFDIPQLKQLVTNTIEKNIPVGAICDAATFLGRNGFLNNATHTGNILQAMKEKPSLYTGDDFFIEKQSVSRDNIITANGTASLEFSYNIMTLLKSDTQENIDEWYTFHKNGAYKQ